MLINPVKTAETSNKKHFWRRVLIGFVIFYILAFITLMVVLTFLASNAALGGAYYQVVYEITVYVTVLLSVLIVLLIVLLIYQLLQARFGSRIRIKWALAFAFMGIVPSLIIYGVSYSFINNHISDWFDVRISEALDTSIKTAREKLDSDLAVLHKNAQMLAQQIQESHSTLEVQSLLDESIQMAESGSVVLIDGAHNIVASNDSNDALTRKNLPSTQVLAVAQQFGQYVSKEMADDQVQINLRVVLVLSYNYQTHYLQILNSVDPAFTKQVLELQKAYAGYQVRALSQQGLPSLFIGALSLAMMLTVFTAILGAAYLAARFSHPLLLLTRGVQSVTEGNLVVETHVESNDEMGALVRAFTKMTKQLREAKYLADTRQQALDQSRSYLEAIVLELDTGIIVLGKQQRIDICNRRAKALLMVELQEGSLLEENGNMGDFVEHVHQSLRHLQSDAQTTQSISEQITMQLANDKPQQTWWLRVSKLAHSEDIVIVFEDISRILAAERAYAWSEVARQLAHEIKNPLTPIQLAAERLEHKLSNVLDGDNAALLTRSVQQIVSQVLSMQRMVKEFSAYARLPSTHKHPVQLNTVIEEVSALYTGEYADKMIYMLDEQLPAISADVGQIRQVILNLLQNALHMIDAQHGRVEFCTRCVGNQVIFEISDNGIGFPAKVLARPFEPYLTTKPTGTGLGLAIVKKIIDEHQAQIKLKNLVNEDNEIIGARVTLTFSALK